jgi:glycosyltransferase involved in cell wall biosynthesis
MTGLRPARKVADRVSVLSPLTLPLGHFHPALKRVNTLVLRLGLRFAMRRMGIGRPLIWTYHPFMRDAINGLARDTLVYHCVDDLAAVPGIDAGRFNAAERALLAEAGAVFVTSPALRDKCAATAPATTYYFPNVADLEHFAVARRPGPLPTDLEAIPRPRLGFVGVLSDFKLDLDLLRRIAEARPDWHLVFIGEEREGQRHPVLASLAQRGNVHFLGYRPYADLPNYLRGMDVGLLPMQINDYTRAAFPMKFFEYLAAGLPVVSTPLPSIAEFYDLCQVAPAGEGFVAAIERVLADRDRFVAPLDHPALQQNSWDSRLDRMLALLAEARHC